MTVNVINSSDWTVVAINNKKVYEGHSSFSDMAADICEFFGEKNVVYEEISNEEMEYFAFDEWLRKNGKS